MYAITFNRTNGSTPTQQERIYKQTKAFEEQLEKLKVELQYDHEKKQKQMGVSLHAMRFVGLGRTVFRDQTI